MAQRISSIEFGVRLVLLGVFLIAGFWVYGKATAAVNSAFDGLARPFQDSSSDDESLFAGGYASSIAVHEERLRRMRHQQREARLEDLDTIVNEPMHDIAYGSAQDRESVHSMPHYQTNDPELLARRAARAARREAMEAEARWAEYESYFSWLQTPTARMNLLWLTVVTVVAFLLRNKAAKEGTLLNRRFGRTFEGHRGDDPRTYDHRVGAFDDNYCQERGYYDDRSDAYRNTRSGQYGYGNGGYQEKPRQPYNNNQHRTSSGMHGPSGQSRGPYRSMEEEQEAERRRIQQEEDEMRYGSRQNQHQDTRRYGTSTCGTNQQQQYGARRNPFARRSNGGGIMTPGRTSSHCSYGVRCDGQRPGRYNPYDTRLNDPARRPPVQHSPIAGRQPQARTGNAHDPTRRLF